MKRWLIALLLFCPLAYGQVSWGEPVSSGITISTPAVAIPAGPSVQLSVSGLTDAELAGTVVTVAPNVGVSVIPAKSWSNQPIIVFGATTPGKYTITVTLHQENEWRLGATQSLIAARAPQLTTELLAEYDAFASGFTKKLTEKYPFKKGSCVVEVAGVVPIPPNPPGPDPPPVTVGTVTTVIIRIVDTLTADQSQVLSDLRQWTDQQPANQVAHLEFPPNAAGPDGEVDKKVAAFVAKIPASSKQPYVFISKPLADGKSAILWQGELPATAEPLIAKIKEFIR